MRKPLRELDPVWLWKAPDKRVREGLQPPDPDSKKIGISFNCPTCDPPHRANAYWKCPFGTGHAWDKKGDALDDLTLFPSLDATKVEGWDCVFHGWVKDGWVTW